MLRPPKLTVLGASNVDSVIGFLQKAVHLHKCNPMEDVNSLSTPFKKGKSSKHHFDKKRFLRESLHVTFFAYLILKSVGHLDRISSAAIVL